MPEDARAVILAGGSGSRLWPLSRLQAPKQFIPLLGDESLLEATVSRLVPIISRSHVLIVTSQETSTGEGYRILKNLETILEPVPRNTAAAIGAAAVRFNVQGIDPVMVVLPADHLIRDIPRFHSALHQAIEAARDGRLMTFGVTPTKAETGFGYIQAGTEPGITRVKSFREKPDLETAKAFLASGDFFWNSGMFVWRASAIRKAIGNTLPDLARTLAAIERSALATGDFPSAVKEHFASAPSISIDKGVLEHSDELFMIRGDFGWSDVGSWDAVHDVAEKDSSQNAISGNALALDCTNTLIRSSHRLVAAVDVDDVSIVETPDAVLVTRRGASQGVRKIVDELVRRSAPEHIYHSTVHRPWGSYTVLEEGPGFKIKRIEVEPEARLSLQSHRLRSEHWVVLEGTARVTCEGRVFDLNPNESTFVPIGARHRLENPGPGLLRIIEVQVGSSVDEADIVRFEDAYGRQGG